MPHSGTFSGHVGSFAGGGETPGDSSFYQTITVPAGGGTLSFWYKTATVDSITFDWQDAYITNTSGTVLATIFHECTTHGYQQVNFNMAPYAGQTVRVKFLAHGDDAGDPTDMFVDDVSLGAGACGTPSPSPTVTPATPTPTPTPSPSPSGSPCQTTFNGAIDTSDPTQTNRLFRSGIASACGTPNACSTLAGTFHYDAYTSVNTTGSPACVTATLTTACTGTNFIFGGSYLNSFDPANICTNNIGDPGLSPNGAPVTWAFTVPAGATFVNVISEVTANAGCAAYTLQLSGIPCGTPLPTPTVTPATPTPTPSVSPSASPSCSPAAWQAGPPQPPARYALQGALGTDNKLYIAGGQLSPTT